MFNGVRINITLYMDMHVHVRVILYHNYTATECIVYHQLLQSITWITIKKIVEKKHEEQTDYRLNHL